MRAIGYGIVAALCIAGPAAANRSAGDVQALADRYVAQGTVPGMVVAVGRGDGALRTTSSGRIAAEPEAPLADANSLWRVYSMTKPITGIAAMMLIEQGKMRLDQPISDFIPAFKDMKVLIDPAKGLESRPAARPITVRNLLTHTAGLGYNIITTGPLLEEYNRLGLNPAEISASMEVRARAARPASLEEFANRVASVPLIADPGAKWSYSISLDVLGWVIEVASGQKFDDFVTTRIFLPLGMRESYWTVPADKVGIFATNYATLGGTRVALDPAASSVYLKAPSFPYGGAGLVMSAHDYDRFLHMLLRRGELGGARILKPETVDLAMSNLLPEGADLTMLGVMGKEAGVPLGFGAGGSVYLADSPLGPGKGTFGWAGAAGTIAWVDPTRKVRATVMINLLGQTPLRPEATRAVYADLAR